MVIAAFRLRHGGHGDAPPFQQPPSVSLVRPLCGIDNFAADTLRSTFELDYPRCEILFCVASAKDPVVTLIGALMANQPAADARLLVGDERVSNNPKLNNVLKGWRAAKHDWIIIRRLERVDAARLHRTSVCQLADGYRALSRRRRSARSPTDSGRNWNARSSIPIRRAGNTSPMRSGGLAQGKTMLWRRADLERAGGIEALANEVAEDAAATKVVRGAGLKVQLVDRPFPQPLGHRTAAEARELGRCAGRGFGVQASLPISCRRRCRAACCR